MERVDRAGFVPAHLRHRADEDGPLPIGAGQTISQPYVVALTSQLAAEGPQQRRVLEIGSGSGFQAAVLAQLFDHVYTVEIIQSLLQQALAAWADQGVSNVTARHGDGFEGWPEHAPYDAIVATCAITTVPDPWWDQLAQGGRIVAPIGGPDQVQRLRVVAREGSEDVIPVRYVPLTRELR